MGEWETLLRLMPPGSGGAAAVDWPALTGSWGRDFPGDYKQFMTVYGFGTIQNFLVVVEPEAKGPLPRSEIGGMLQETATAELTWEHVRKAPQLSGVAPLLIAWGVSAGADILCWDATSTDPDDWPVLVVHRGDSLWRRYDCGMVEFLARLLRSGFDACPLSGTDLWGVPSAKFLTPAQERHLLGQGLDPWTGQPDPFAGMYGNPAG